MRHCPILRDGVWTCANMHVHCQFALPAQGYVLRSDSGELFETKNRLSWLAAEADLGGKQTDTQLNQNRKLCDGSSKKLRTHQTSF